MNLIGQPIAVIGLGYVGLPLAVEFGKRYPVTGFDIKPERIAELQAGRDSTREVEPQELAAAVHLRYSSDPADLRDCRVFIVTVPTPVDHVNRPDFTPLVKASDLAPVFPDPSYSQRNAASLTVERRAWAA